MRKVILALALASQVLFVSNAFAGTYYDKQKQTEESISESTPYSIIYFKNGNYIIGRIFERNTDTIKVYTDKFVTLLISEIESIVSNEKSFSKKEYDEVQKNKQKSTKVRNLEEQKESLSSIKKEIKEVIKLETEIEKDKKNIDSLEKDKKEAWFENPNYTRLLVGPTARTPKRGKGYIQDIDVFLLTSNYGISDNFSIGGMTSFMPGMSADRQIFSFNGKVSVDLTPDLSLGAGAMYLNGMGLKNAGIGYAAFTYGSTDSYLNLGFGASYGDMENSQFFPGLRTTLQGKLGFISMLGGTYRIHKNFAIISENYIVTDAESRLNSFIISKGLRLFWEGLSIDLAIIYPMIPNTKMDAIPYLDYVWHF